MSNEKDKLHMSFQLENRDILPPLQKRIVLHLSQSDPQTINEVVKSLKGSYKSTWIAFNSLKDKKIIEPVSSKAYRGRNYPCFWVSSTGVIIALFEGVNPQSLLEKSLITYPKDTNLQAFLEISPIVGYEGFKQAFQILQSKGKLEQSDIAAIILTVAQKDFDISQLVPLIELVKKYPKQLESTKKYAEGMSEKLAKIESLLKNKD